MNPEQVPPRRRCGAAIVYQRLLETDETFRTRQLELEDFSVARGLEITERVAGPVIIPVVVHVLWNTPNENISDAQVFSQLVVLNDDFRARNPDKINVPDAFAPVVADTNIEFVLATTDPDGQPTNGITRTRTQRTSFLTDDAMKFTARGGVDAWPTDRYLNVWVCDLGDGLLGYAQFPGGPAETDGVVILHTAFGTEGTAQAPFNLGRTTTHEVGHWLNLFHIWGDSNDCSGSDLVDDTPPAQLPNFGQPSFPHVSCNNGPNGDMFMNYMDYVDDAAMFMFSQGQAARMEAALADTRSGFRTLAINQPPIALNPDSPTNVEGCD